MRMKAYKANGRHPMNRPLPPMKGTEREQPGYRLAYHMKSTTRLDSTLHEIPRLDSTTLQR